MRSMGAVMVLAMAPEKPPKAKSMANLFKLLSEPIVHKFCTPSVADKYDECNSNQNSLSQKLLE